MKDLSIADGDMIFNDFFKSIAYEKETGLFWRVNKKGEIIRKKPCGTNVHGYTRLMTNGKIYAAHRLAWYFVHGQWPVDQIDHINMIRNDNRIENLRESNQSENQWNTTLRSDNTSGIKDVCWHKRMGLWFVQISANKGKRHTKYFPSLEEAEIWAKNKREELHGKFVRHK